MNKKTAIILVLLTVLTLGVQGAVSAHSLIDPPPPRPPSVDPKIGAIQNGDGIWFLRQGGCPIDREGTRAAPLRLELPAPRTTMDITGMTAWHIPGWKHQAEQIQV